MPLRIYSEQTKQFPCVMGIASGKGGVGKSTLTAHLALALKTLGHRVGILDADLYGPSMTHLMPEEVPPQRKGEKWVPATSRGISLLSMTHLLSGSQAAGIRAPIVNRLLSQMVHGVDWGGLDFLLIDFPPGTGDILLTLAQTLQIQGVILVTTPQEVALLDVRKVADIFSRMQVPLLGVVENMSYFFNPISEEKIPVFGKGGGARLAEEFHIPLLAEIPLDPLICQSCDQGKSVIDQPQGENFLSIAEALIGTCGKGEDEVAFELCESDGIRIRWRDGQEQFIIGKELQKRCPCALCQGKKETADRVEIRGWQLVGRYAVRFQFSSGCSAGIYRLDELKRVNR